MTKTDLHKIARWKAARSAGRVERNSEADVREITRIAFLTTSERARVESLLILDGVGWPMASVILHFYHRDPYPILDYRALWSSSLRATAYDFLAQFGRVSRRFDRSARHYLGWLELAACIILLRSGFVS